ncbi:MAG: purine-nucleoside phosphorylase [Peptococcaceae bacterium]|nr:purine-nucleoside phosphorylase [Peptococcaceae bacterium]
MTLLNRVEETVAYIRTKTSKKPEIAIVLGSGLGQLGEKLEDVDVIPYEELPHWKSSTAPGHSGRLLFGILGGKQVVCMQGRLHYYEGYSMEDITYPVRVMAKLGVKNLLLSNAAGGINTDFAPGQLMLITDHINFLGRNPLMGPNEADFGVRFCDMSYAYHPELRKIALEAAEELGQKLEQGVYVATTGPSYETPAEIRMFRLWGASAVGMSTVPEVIVANHSGIRVMGISCITNMAAGVLDQPLTEEEVLETGAKSGAEFQALMTRIVEKL